MIPFKVNLKIHIIIYNHLKFQIDLIIHHLIKKDLIKQDLKKSYEKFKSNYK